MRRIQVEKRPNANRLVQSQGLVYSKTPAPGDTSDPYWPDDRYYSFSSKEIELLEKAGQDVFDMCCEAADFLVENPDVVTGKMAIPAFALRQIKESWNRDPAWGSVYGRFDVCFGGLEHGDARLRVPKFYEFNADTPTSLVEAASIQWSWLEQTGHGNDQLNSLVEKLVAAWARNLALVEKELGRRPAAVHFAIGYGERTGEDAMNAALLMDTCRQAGWATKSLYVEQIAKSPEGRFFDQDGQHIDVVFKLYPWEYMVEQEFGEACFEDMGRADRDKATIWIEPPYKMLWSNKALFAVLWDLFRDDPRSKWLLPTYFEDEAPASLTRFARKPIFAREGADVLLQADGRVIQDAATGHYGKEGYVMQELALLPEFKDDEDKTFYPVLGLWLVDGEVAGVGIREDKTPITTNGSWFIPHSISDGPVCYDRTPIPDADEIEAVLTLESYEGLKQGNGVMEYIESVVG
ncbi:Glutathionylspermidine synthase [Daldinia caldariorum]|uniref:Glutathionylspermidine synthase n=1 Tax=Daldinia caldariorum TaxID=326644 RepID=UPI00200752D6|nr:Glutathionylspermidine synthase [Daldinia caldariorum]KAI1465470.1 Glutathionylspermidine synthase [Daldinia caldariorum]